MGFDRSQPSFIGTYEGENKGRKRRIREGGGFKEGDGAAEPTNGVKTHINLHGYTWDLVSQATTHNQACIWTEGGCLCVKGGWSSGGSMKRCNPPLWQIGTPWYHLFVILNWQRAQEARVLHKPYQVWLCAGELIPPKTLIVILSWCRGICRAPTAKPTAGLSGRWGCCVYMCALSGDWANCTHRIIDGTQLPQLVLLKCSLFYEHMIIFFFCFSF